MKTEFLFLRLTLTLMLGLAGAILCPARIGFFPNPFGGFDGMAAVAWIVLAVLAALVLWWFERRPEHAETEWFESILWAHVTMAVAPLMLFAERPSKGPLILRCLFGIFPYLLALGFFPFFAASFRLENYFLGFSTYAWIGCGILYVFVPRPEPTKRLLRAGFPCAVRWGSLQTVVFLAIPLVPMSPLTWRPLTYIASGELFAHVFDSRTDVGALDQGTLHKALFLSAWFGTILIPYVFAARWAADRTTLRGYLAFAIPAVGLMLCPLAFLFIGSWGLGQYVFTMGLTPRRVIGLAYAACAFAAIAATFFLIFRRKKTTESLPPSH